MTRRQIESQFYGLAHLNAPHGGQYFVAVKNTMSTGGVSWVAEIHYLDTERGDLQIVSRRAGKKRHWAMLSALRDFDKGHA